MNILSKHDFEEIKLFKLGSNLLGKPQMFVYSFLVDGLLIDTGQPHIKKQFSAALREEFIDQIILTHHHEDHSGNVEAIKQLKGLEAFASQKCCEIMRSPPRMEPARLVTWGQVQNASLKPLQSDEISTQKFKFKIIATPGHAIDQISLYEASRGWLFSGDLYVHDYVKVFMRDEEIGDQIQSIRKLLHLDFDVLLCNHQPIFKNGKERLKTKLDFLEDFYGKVEQEYLKGIPANRIMKALGLKENNVIKWFSFGQLSTMNMIRSVLRSIKKNES